MDPRPQIVLDNLRRIVQAVRQSQAMFERTSGLTSAQALILKLIAANPAISVGDIAAKTLTHQSTVSEVIGRMEAKGLVVRVRAADDGRRRELQLTPDGEEALLHPVETIQETLIKGLEALPSDKLDCLVEGLEALIASSGLGVEPAPMFMEDGLQS